MSRVELMYRHTTWLSQYCVHRLSRSSEW